MCVKNSIVEDSVNAKEAIDADKVFALDRRSDQIQFNV